MPPIIGIVAAGAMGAPVAGRLTAHNCTVLTNLAGRSQATKDRAAAAGMLDSTNEDIALRADIFLSIVPPKDAETLAKDFIASVKAIGDRNRPLIYADCNAVNPDSTQTIYSLFVDHNKVSQNKIVFIDGCIIGGPPEAGYDPTFYVSANAEDRTSLDEFVHLGSLGLKIKTLTGQGASVGDASALKMCYAGIAKGLTGLLMTMTLTASASSPATVRALLDEIAESQPLLLKRVSNGIPQSLPKAYRWIGEMHEISGFVDSMAAQDGFTDSAAPIGDIHKGLAHLFTRLRDDERARETLKDISQDAKERLEKS